MKEKSSFQQDVEVVLQALERQKRDDPWEEGQRLYKKYREAAKEPVRLAAALRGFFLPEGISEEQRKGFGHCLQEQIVPAIQELIEEEDVEKIAYLESLGWICRNDLELLIRTARERQKTASLVWLMHLKDRKYGYEEKTFQYSANRDNLNPGNTNQDRVNRCNMNPSNTNQDRVNQCNTNRDNTNPDIESLNVDNLERKDFDYGNAAYEDPNYKNPNDGKLDYEDPGAALGIEILKNCRNELYSYFPYMDGAFANVSYETSKLVKGIGTEGNIFYFVPAFLRKKYLQNPAAVRRGYLHMMLHCLYLHLFLPENCGRDIWDLACDISVEQVIEQVIVREDQPGLRLPDDPVRKRCFEKLKGKSFSAETISHMLQQGIFLDSLEELRVVFCFDDHRLWYLQQSAEKAARTKSKWEKILAYTGQNRHEKKHKMGTGEGDGEEEAVTVHKSRYDYRKFLKRFAAAREEVELDTESFDYIMYHFGMEHYGDMPLIEPLEYKEVNRLEELVIAVDTSGSCSKETVQQFLAETYSILSERENFFRKMKVHIVQCDCSIQEAVVIHSEEEWKAYSRNIKIKGRGGTDFRPVFRYIAEQKEKKEIRNIKALIYFTDGDGIYPKCKPEYETAFVFLEESKSMGRVPAWAMKLLALSGGKTGE